MIPVETFSEDAKDAAKMVQLVYTQFESDEPVDEEHITGAILATLLSNDDIVSNSLHLSQAFEAPINCLFERWLTEDEDSPVDLIDITKDDIKAHRNIFEYFDEKLTKYPAQAYLDEASANKTIDSAFDYILQVAKLHDVKINDEIQEFREQGREMYGARAEQFKVCATIHPKMHKLIKKILRFNEITAFMQLMTLLRTLSKKFIEIDVPSDKYVQGFLEICKEGEEELRRDPGNTILSDKTRQALADVIIENGEAGHDEFHIAGQEDAVSADSDSIFTEDSPFSEIVKKYGVDTVKKTFMKLRKRIMRVILASPWSKQEDIAKELNKEFGTNIPKDHVILGEEGAVGLSNDALSEIIEATILAECE